VISLEHVTRSFATRSGQVRVLDDLNLQIPEKQFVCICGPSGCGKTTLLMTLGGMLRPDRGKVSIEGEDLYALCGAARASFRARELGFVFQMFHLLPYLSVLDNVLLPARRLGGLELRRQREAAKALIERLGLAHRAEHKPGQLSAGERQRTAIARATLLRPPVLLADEPTGNLDEQSAAEVYRILGDYRDGGGSVLVVTHGREALAYADQVIRFDNGRFLSTQAANPSPADSTLSAQQTQDH
jgi:putative ABC transport system ATP-binding protein